MMANENADYDGKNGNTENKGNDTWGVHWKGLLMATVMAMMQKGDETHPIRGLRVEVALMVG